MEVMKFYGMMFTRFHVLPSQLDKESVKDVADMLEAMSEDQTPTVSIEDTFI